MMKKMTLIIAINILLVVLFLCIAQRKMDLFNRVLAHYHNKPYVPERSDECCVVSWNNSIKKLNLKVDVVFFGDSHIASGDWEKVKPGLNSINLGYIGEDTKGMLRRVETIASVHPKKVFLMAGINGLKTQTLDDFEFWYTALVDSILKTTPNVELYVESILPVTYNSKYCDNEKIQKANEIIKKVALDKKVLYVDLYQVYSIDGALPNKMSSDGLHLNPEAYAPWYQVLQKLVDE